MKRITFIALSLLAGLALLSSCKKDQVPSPEGDVTEPVGQHATFYSSVLTYEVTSNCDWSVSLDEDSPLSIDPLEGTAGTSVICVTLPDNKTQDVLKSSFSVVFKNSADESFSYVVEIEQPRPSVEIGGMSYKVAYLADGQYWMTENLRYCPDGKTVSKDLADIANGVWYPVATDGTNVTFDESAEGVLEKGYLYTAEVAFGEAITKDNFDKFDKVQGICPEGWHIPDFDDWFGLVGKANGKDSDKTAPYFDEALGTATSPGSGSIAKAEADGMPVPITGEVIVANASATKGSLAGTNGKAPDKALNMGYILGSTAYQKTVNADDSIKNVQYYSLMSHKINGTIALAYSGYRYGVSVRCVKDSAAPDSSESAE
jgi:uncharacterized protein (TIGR02145 family)